MHPLFMGNFNNAAHTVVPSLNELSQKSMCLSFLNKENTKDISYFFKSATYDHKSKEDTKAKSHFFKSKTYNYNTVSDGRVSSVVTHTTKRCDAPNNCD